jgi:transposase-like protein
LKSKEGNRSNRIYLINEILTLCNICSAHEDIERLEQAIVDQYMEDAKTHREKLYNEHIVDKFLTRIADKSQYIYDLYEDNDG